VSALLRLEGVSVDFFVRRGFFSSTPVRAVRDVSLALERGENLAVVGESGSGKTTLGRAVLRLVPTAAGRVLFDGQDVGTLEGAGLMAFRRRAQLVSQDPYSSLSPYMRVFDLVAEPLVVHGGVSRKEQERRVIAALESVRLAPAAEMVSRYPHTLSGGQRQRVNIARALVSEPEFLVADEPVSMIDASSRAEILSLLRDLGTARGLTMLSITHDLASARHSADRIAVMYAGRVVEVAPARALIEDPRHPYTRALLAAVPEPDPANRLRQRPVVGGEPPSPSALPPGCAFHPRCPVAIAGTCEVIDPPLVRRSGGGLVACHHEPDVGAGDADGAGEVPGEAGARDTAGEVAGDAVAAGLADDVGAEDAVGAADAAGPLDATGPLDAAGRAGDSSRSRAATIQGSSASG
jgi:oligopeptide/dipeptide ABC transporter ATP-binding protein